MANAADGVTPGQESKVTQVLKLKICNSEWCSLPFDMAKLQSDPIKIKDGVEQEREGQLQP